MAAAKLRAVKDGEMAPKRTLSILQAAVEGDRLEELQSMRRRIATAMDDPNTPARDLAALSRRQIEIGREVEVLLNRADEEAKGAAHVADGSFNAAAI